MGFSFAAPFLSTWGTKEVGFSPRGFSLFMLAAASSAILVSLVVGRLSDTRFSRRGMMVLGGVGGCLGFAGYGLIRDPLLLVLVACGLQSFGSVCFAQLFSHVREAFASPLPGAVPVRLTMSVVRVCFSLAWTVGPAIGSVVLLMLGFEGLFLAAAGLYLVFLLGVLRWVPKGRPLPESGGPPRIPVWQTLRRPDLFACFVAFAAFFAANNLNMMVLPLALTGEIGGNPADIGIAFGIGPVVELPLMLWFGHLAGKGHQLRLIKIGAVVTVVYFVLLYLCDAPWQVFAAQVLHGMMFAIFTNVGILFFQDLVPGQLGLATSVFASAGAAGNLVGLSLFGFAAEAFGNRGSFLVSAAVAVVGAVILLCYRPRQV